MTAPARLARRPLRRKLLGAPKSPRNKRMRALGLLPGGPGPICSYSSTVLSSLI